MRRSTVPTYLTQLRMVEGEGGGGDQGGGGGNAGGTGSTDDGKGGDNKGGTSTPFDNITDPAELRALAVRLQNEAAQSRTKSRDQVAAAAAETATQQLSDKIAEALGLKTKPADPAELTRQLEAVRAEATEKDRELAIYRAALKPGADVNVGRLMDSRSFMRKVDKIDPNSDTAEADIAAAITEAVSSDASLKASGRVAAGGGSVGHAGGAGDHHQTDLSKLHGETLLSAAYAQNSQK